MERARRGNTNRKESQFLLQSFVQMMSVDSPKMNKERRRKSGKGKNLPIERPAGKNELMVSIKSNNSFVNDHLRDESFPATETAIFRKETRLMHSISESE